MSGFDRASAFDVPRGEEACMEGWMTRRQFVGSMPLLPFAAQAALAAQTQPEKPSFPIIDTHIHIFDKTRPEGAPYPRDVPGGEPPQGMIALPNRYKAVVAPFGVVGAPVIRTTPGWSAASIRATRRSERILNS
jgi:hypothetical protein